MIFLRAFFPLLHQGYAMTDAQHTSLADIAKHFDTLEDPRSPINRHHLLTNVVVIAIMAILAGANGPTAIAKWALAKHANYRRQFGGAYPKRKAIFPGQYEWRHNHLPG